MVKKAKEYWAYLRLRIFWPLKKSDILYVVVVVVLLLLDINFANFSC